MASEVRKRLHTNDNRIWFRAGWDEYQALARAIGDQHVRLAYDGERVELMRRGPEHELLAGIAGVLVRALASVQGVLCKSMGMSRWERTEARRGVEGDATFYLNPDKIAVARRRPKKAADWPLPDLAIEIDMSPSEIDRPGIYAALGVAEVWRFDGETLRIDRLGADGTYSDAPESGWLGVRPEEVVHLLSIDAEDDNDFANRVLAWARDVLVPRREQGRV
jgi:Uma2 family endonuclease